MKVLSLFRSLSSNDVHWLGKFVASPAHCRQREVRVLFEYFRENADTDCDADFFTTEKLSQLLFGDGPTQQAKTHHACNYFLKTIENCLAWLEWETDPTERQRWLARALQNRRQEVQSLDSLQVARALEERKPLRNPTFLRTQYHLDLEVYQLEIQLKRPTNEFLQRLSDGHDAAFVAEKLKNACILASRQRVERQEFDTGLLAEVLRFVEARPTLLELPAVAVYFHGYRCLTEPENEAAFRSLRGCLTQFAANFTAAELRDIYQLAILFCIHRINRREEKYVREVFEIYKSGLDAGVFLENGAMTRFTFTNVVSTALRLREFDWALQFIENQKDTLPEEVRHGTYSFNLARYFSDRGDYDRAMPLLQQMDFDDPQINLQGKMMLLKMYFETAETAALKSLLDSTETYLRRKNRLGEQTQRAHRNTLRFVRRLVALKPGDMAGRAALREEIEGTAEVAMKEWLVGCF